MATCDRYTYTNPQDGSEVLLNSYSELADFVAKVAAGKQFDIVFDNTARDLKKIALGKIWTANKSLKARSLLEAEQLGNDLETYAVSTKNCIGVTRFLSGLRVYDGTEEGKLLFPEFRKEEYWKRAISRWEKGDFNEEEKSFLFDKDASGNYVIDTSAGFDSMRKTIEEKWLALATIGTEIHKVMETFFHPKNNVRFNTDEYMLDHIMKTVKPKHLQRETISQLILLGRAIEKQFGKNANYYPEFKVSGMTTFTNESGELLKLVGVIDLLVLDETGSIHIIDYKTSPLPYIDYPSAKKRTFMYQMATYSKLLRLLGLNDAGTSVYITPIELINLHKEGDSWKIDGVQHFEHMEELSVLDDVNIQNNIENFLTDLPAVDSTPDDIILTVEEWQSTFLPGYHYGKKVEQSTIEELVEKGALRNDETNKWYIQYDGSTIIADSKESLVKKIQDLHETTPKRRRDYTVVLKKKLKESLESAETGKFVPITFSKSYSDPDWLNNQMSKYMSPNWEVLLGNDITDWYGMILLENKLTHLIDVLMVTGRPITSKVKLPYGKKLSGFKQADIKEDSKPDSLAMDAIEGNIELIKALVILNQTPNLFSRGVLGEVTAINPFTSKALSASNELLKYNWDMLNELLPVAKVNNIAEGHIKMAKYWDLCYKRFDDIMEQFSVDWKAHADWQLFSSCQSKFEQVSGDPVQQRTMLILLKKDLEDKFPGIADSNNRNDVNAPQVRLYEMVQLAIAESSGIKLQLVYEDSSSYLESVNVLTSGLTGLEIDNPGNLKNQNLNMITKLVMRVYQNVREALQRKVPDIDKQIQALKDSKGYGTLKERTFGNPASLYTNMIDYRDGNLYIKNPWKNHEYSSPMTSLEVEFAKFFLLEINKHRRPDKVANLESTILNSNDPFFWLPLAVGDTKTAIAVKGLLPALKDKLKKLSPKNIAQWTKDSIYGFIEDSGALDNSAKMLYLMNTQFDRGENQVERLRMITENTAKYGPSYYEHNLETLLLKHIFSYTTKEYMDEVFPDILAIATNIKLMAYTGNEEFKGLTDYVQNFINSKILGKRIDGEKFTTLEAYGKQVMKFASLLALAFNPRQLYQGIEGIWKDISLFIRKPDGTTSFTFSNLKDSFLSALPEMIHYRNGKTKWEWLNETYALNDMGTDEYVNRIKSDRHGIWGFWSRIAYKFASRPDFYNRATIFGALMRGSQCWEAHVFEDDRWIYKMELDGRFDRFARGDKSDINKYNEQKALYISMARQMELEHTRNADGTLFKMRNEDGSYNNLPKAFTVQLSESLKDVSDSIYGYYANEKKALIQSHGLGAMLMQMNTYWSAKKNQFLAPGSVKLQGKLEKVEGLWLDDNGNVTQTDTGVPYMQWKGDYQEGILLTVTKILWGDGTLKENWDNIFNASDENLRRAYRANLGQLVYDFFMYMFIGQMLAGSLLQNAKEYAKKNKDAFENLSVNFAANIFKQSFIDYNWTSSIFGRGMSWTPFSLETVTRLYDNWSDVVSGDRSAKSALINSTGLTRTMKVFFNTIN